MWPLFLFLKQPQKDKLELWKGNNFSTMGLGVGLVCHWLAQRENQKREGIIGLNETREQVESKPNLTSPDLKRCRLILVLLKYPARCLSVRLLYAASNLKQKNETIKVLWSVAWEPRHSWLSDPQTVYNVISAAMSSAFWKYTRECRYEQFLSTAISCEFWECMSWKFFLL